MSRPSAKLLFVASHLLVLLSISHAVAQAPDGSVKISSRMVASGIGLSWGDGVLTYKGRDYPFTFKASGLFRDVDAEMTAAELSGQVFNLKKPEDFAGNYHTSESNASASGGGTRATMKNQNGVVVNLQSAVAGRKFNLSREGLTVELKNQRMEKNNRAEPLKPRRERQGIE